ncbi:SAM-dependent methyltransferase [Salinifilum ghardaiensis]
MSAESPMSMQPPPEVNDAQPNSARMYDFLLGGSANFAVDREAVADMQRVFPDAAHYAGCNRAFLGRVVRYLCRIGIDQFLDLGSGVPTVGNVHEIALAENPAARVAYVDHEPVAVHHARRLLGAGEERVSVTQADLRDPDAVWNAPGVTGLLDLTRPVGLLAVGVLPFVLGGEARALMTEYHRRLAPGSYAAVSHLAQLGMTDEQLAAGLEVMRRTPTPEEPRTVDEVREVLAAYALVEPGIVPVPTWHPESSPSEDEVQRSNCIGGIGRRA